jgi:dihydrofolate reductase
MISIIVAYGLSREIGLNNQLLWHLPNDLNHFKQITMGHPIVMGRKTFESIGRPLPGRVNVIVTRNTDFKPEGCLVVNSLQDAFKATMPAQDVMIIGGADIYEQTLPIADRIYATEVKAHLKADKYFPVLPPNQWEEISRKINPADEKNAIEHDFVVYKRKLNN